MGKKKKEQQQQQRHARDSLLTMASSSGCLLGSGIIVPSTLTIPLDCPYSIIALSTRESKRTKDRHEPIRDSAYDTVCVCRGRRKKRSPRCGPMIVEDSHKNEQEKTK